METEIGAEYGSEWRSLLRKHWNIFALLVAVGILLVIGSVYVFWWFADLAQGARLVPSVLRFWTMAHIVVFVVNLIFWELIFIGIPAIIGAVAGWQWWKRLPEDEKKGYRFFSRRSRTTGGGGGLSLFFFIVFAVKVYIDGNWNVPISNWTLDYVIGSIILILLWIAVIFGIPIAIGVIWWIRHEMRRSRSGMVGSSS